MLTERKEKRGRTRSRVSLFLKTRTDVAFKYMELELIRFYIHSAKDTL